MAATKANLDAKIGIMFQVMVVYLLLVMAGAYVVDTEMYERGHGHIWQ